MGLPSLPRTVPVITQSLKAISPVNLRVSIIILDTHKKIISRPVTKTSVGRNTSKSEPPAWAGGPDAALRPTSGPPANAGGSDPVQPNVENAQSPEENQVSRTSL